MRPPHLAAPPLRAVFDAARDFGLSEDEVWHAVDESLAAAAPDGTLSDSLDELAAALARRILSKQRRILAEDRRRAWYA